MLKWLWKWMTEYRNVTYTSQTYEKDLDILLRRAHRAAAKRVAWKAKDTSSFHNEGNNSP